MTISINNIITGIKSDDLKLTDEELDTLKTQILNSTLAWTNTYLKQSYSLETVPLGLDEIIINISQEILNIYNFQMDTPVIDTENFKITTYIKQVITDDIEKRLKPFKKGITIGVFSLTPNTTITDEDVVE